MNNYLRIEKALKFLIENYKSQPSLEEIAKVVFLSPYHFQRLFTDWVGISPKKFVRYLTIEYLKDKLKETQNMMEAAEVAGLSSQSRVHDLFVKIEGVTADQFKNSGSGLEIYYGYHSSPFGMCFIAVSEKGICAFNFIDEEQKRNEFELFSSRWNFAKLIHKPDYTQYYLSRIFNVPDLDPERINLLVQGTEFQIKVWEALVRIPFGAVSSFQNIANVIEHPKSARAVSSAVAVNPINFLIPCHRVITSNGTVGNYHWGKVRKQVMIAWESSKIDLHKKNI